VAVSGRILADAAGRAEAGSVFVAFDAATYALRWRERFPERAAPPVAMTRDVVFIFDVLVGSGCPDVYFEGLGYDQSQRLLYGIFAASQPYPHCGDVAADHTFIVAARRIDLPTGSFHVRVMREFQLCADCGRENEQVALTL